LPEQSRSRCTNRSPHGNFALPGFRADQQQARYIHARDQQQ
jgi:hypothetical protein